MKREYTRYLRSEMKKSQDDDDDDYDDDDNGIERKTARMRYSIRYIRDDDDDDEPYNNKRDLHVVQLPTSQANSICALHAHQNTHTYGACGDAVCR